MLNDLRDTFGYGIPELFFRKFCSEYQTVYDAFVIKPSNAVARDHDAMVCGMIKDGDWQTKDIFYITAAQSSVDSLLNWINPGTHDLTVVNLAAGQFIAYRGWTGNGVDGYLNTNYNPNTDAVNYVLDDAGFGCYIRTDVNALEYDMGCVTGGNWAVQVSRSGNIYLHRINDGTWTTIANLDSRGFYINSRLLANATKGYKNKIEILTGAIASIGLPNTEMYLMAYNSSGSASSFSTRQIAAAFAGSGMTQTNVNNFTDRLNTFMTAIGANVF